MLLFPTAQWGGFRWHFNREGTPGRLCLDLPLGWVWKTKDYSCNQSARPSMTRPYTPLSLFNSQPASQLEPAFPPSNQSNQVREWTSVASHHHWQLVSMVWSSVFRVAFGCTFTWWYPYHVEAYALCHNSIFWMLKSQTHGLNARVKSISHITLILWCFQVNMLSIWIFTWEYSMSTLEQIRSLITYFVVLMLFWPIIAVTVGRVSMALCLDLWPDERVSNVDSCFHRSDETSSCHRSWSLSVEKEERGIVWNDMPTIKCDVLTNQEPASKIWGRSAKY